MNICSSSAYLLFYLKPTFERLKDTKFWFLQKCTFCILLIFMTLKIYTFCIESFI